MEEVREQLARSEYLRALAEDSATQFHAEMDRLRSALKESEQRCRLLEQQKQTAAPPPYPHYSSPGAGEEVLQMRALQEEVRALQFQIQEFHKEREKLIEERVAALLAARKEEETSDLNGTNGSLNGIALREKEEPVYSERFLQLFISLFVFLRYLLQQCDLPIVLYSFLCLCVSGMTYTA